MNLEQLRGFVEVARLGHFTRASEHLHLAQPSLSRQISTLETELGAELFHRARGHIALTAAGEMLLPRAQRMLAEAEAIRDEMAALRGLRRGRVRLGAPPTLCLSLVAEALRTFHAAHPDIDLELIEAGSRVLIEQLAVGAVDIALVPESDSLQPASVSLDRTPLLAEELVVVSSASRPPLTSGEPITLTALAALPLITVDESYELRAATDAAFRAAGLTPTPVLAGGELGSMLRFVERGLGVAVAPAMALFDRPSLRSVRLADPLTRTISLAHRSDVTPAAAVAAMQQVIVTTASDLAARDPATTSLL